MASGNQSSLERVPYGNSFFSGPAGKPVKRPVPSQRLLDRKVLMANRGRLRDPGLSVRQQAAAKATSG